METLISIVLIVSGVIQIILIFKVWGMTNKVKGIYNILCRQKTDAGDLEFIELVEYIEANIRMAKKMKALGDDKSDALLKGLLYDIDNYFEENNSYHIRAACKYREIINGLLNIDNA